MPNNSTWKPKRSCKNNRSLEAALDKLFQLLLDLLKIEKFKKGFYLETKSKRISVLLKGRLLIMTLLELLCHGERRSY